MACVTGGPAVEPALTNAARFIMDTGVAAKELRSRLGLTGLHPRPRIVDDPDLCRRAAMAMGGSERSTDLPGILLVQMGPAYIARRDGVRYPEYYFGQRIPFGSTFEIIEVLTSPD